MSASDSTQTKLSHFNEAGQAHMVDVGNKAETARLARAEGWISMQRSVLDTIRQGHAKKGDVLGIARIAAIQGAKRTADLIPLCHPLPLTHVEVEFELHEGKLADGTPIGRVRIVATAETVGRTGVEMEALCAVNAGLLTIYDMCKAADRGMQIENVRLLEKKGGKSGHWIAPAANTK